jgi:hypothetical protein
MEQRFGHDFGDIRVHTDRKAAESARAINALAFTVGRDVVFGEGGYAPHTNEGRRLMAHELTHTVQQRGLSRTHQPDLKMDEPDNSSERAAESAADAITNPPMRLVDTGSKSDSVVQRKCRTELGSPDPDCTESDTGAVGWQFLFKVGCDDLLPGEEAKVSKLTTRRRLNIHGFASIEGPPTFNMELSCHRANRIAELVRKARPDCPIARTFKHGASPASDLGVVPDPNPPSFWRSVFVEEIRPDPGKSVCGPDATDWLVQQVVAAKKNPKVLHIRDKIDVANFFAPLISPSANLNAMDMLEGQELLMIGKAWEAAGKPTPTADANQQMGEPSATFGVIEVTTAKTEALAGNTNALTTLFALRDAAIAWRELVGTKKPYDFKNDPSTMGNPKTAHCPDADCANTITLCPGSPGSNCFEKDLPGNVVFAHVGAFVGFSENALQLGSQWAQLVPSGGSHWDPPEDTQMIDFGFNLPSPFTRAGFCAGLQSAKSGFKTHPCNECTETSTAVIVNP